jgi:arabinogalactan endo-1,4-beta-galactosidase
LLLSIIAVPAARTQPFLIGADISWVDADEAGGAKYFENGVQTDVFQIFKDYKFNCIRLRIFVNPAASGGYSSQGYCDLAHTMKMAKRIYGAGMYFLLDFHYSDTWADPSNQKKPSAWNSLAFAPLTDTVYAYTKNVITQLKNQGTPPHMCQIGNEINPGMLLNDGSTNNWTNLGALLKAGIKGVKDVDSTIKVCAHLAWGNDYASTKWWMDAAIAQGVKFDVLGESCYTEWHGQPADWKANFDSLVKHYPNMKFMIAEYSKMKREANDVIFGLPNERGIGTFIWEPTRWDEPTFTRSGNNYTPDSLMNLYPKMSKDYGNDTFTTAVAPNAMETPKIARYAATIVFNNGNSAYVRYAVPGECDIEVTVHSMDGKTVARMSSRATKAGEGIVPWNAIGAIRSGAYLFSFRTDGATKSVSQIMICK